MEEVVLPIVFTVTKTTQLILRKRAM